MRETPTVDLPALRAGQYEDFALLYRPQANGDQVELLAGTVGRIERLAELPAPTEADQAGIHSLVVVPFRQAHEQGYDCRDDGSPLLVLNVRATGMTSRSELLRQLPDAPVGLTDGGFDDGDDEYAETIRRVVRDEIGRGEGANFVIRRTFRALLSDASIDTALSVFRRLLSAEHGAYWTFLVRAGGHTFVGASPEQHVGVVDGQVTMNPISGTYRFGSTGPSPDEVLRFLADEKEVDELFMVVDEELKMMARICDRGGRVIGPYLKQMARIAHTEYLLAGRSGLDVRDLLRETMFAPTVTGSPVESAFRVISRHESTGRGYYSGVLALIGLDGAGRQTLDSAIMIRTMHLNPGGELSIGVGATLVRHSDPHAEVAETHAKIAALLDALQGSARTPRPAPARTAPELSDIPHVRRALRRRNRRLARFWLDDPDRRHPESGRLTDRRILVIDAEDQFTTMLAQQFRSLGPQVTVVPWHRPVEFDAADLVVVGPGPGDPRQYDNPKIARLRSLTAQLLSTERRFVSICLGHQVLADLLGYALIRKSAPNQGRQATIELFGRPRRVGFYNTFAALATTSQPDEEYGPVEASFDPRTGEIHSLRAARFQSLQFHPESVLSIDGLDVLAEILHELLSAEAVVNHR
ncbi:anthranilate synthase family protein [Verrucosispora sioxanthis]|uniref:anthranilate synthase n=1 Tax=Verrucosispora sioxanthis TaxID=2499994 RepID=A0A6M1KUG2_9ACTN|nr:chorismate-binding protein [Verrucosispora sioxanthis]NEE64538.1 hypothetical protein [Verrucosispora sioxanthis]NGM13648.1 hypothetical protein [Verrucosispora sioxanthis]